MAHKTPSLVKETTTTTGTGNYALAGAVGDFRAFSAALADGDFVPYVARMGADFEVGLGQYLVTGNALARTKVLESSNAGAAVNWAAGEKEIYVDLGAPFVLPGRMVYDQAAFPVLSNGPDGTSQGYGPVSFWHAASDPDVTGQSGLFVCLNPLATSPQWYPVAGGFCRAAFHGSGPYKHHMRTGSLGNGFHLVTRLAVEQASCTGHAGEVAHDVSHVFGLGYDNNQTNEGGHQKELVGLTGYTIDATSTILYPGNFNNIPVTVPLDCGWLFKIRVAARASGGDVKFWTIKGALKRGTTGDPAFVGTPVVTVEAEDTGATGWTANVSIDAVNDALQVNVAGAAATTIVWSGELDLVQVAFR